MKDGFTSLLNAKAVRLNYIIVRPGRATRLILFNDRDTQT